MAANGPIIAIDIGAYAVKVGMFRPFGQGLILDGFYTSPLGADGGNEDARHAAVAHTLRTALANQRLSAATVAYSVAGHSVFMRFVKLPPSAPEQVAQMVRYEALQNVPFKLEEVVWDYQLLQGADSSEVEAVIVAMKADVLDRVNGPIAGLGVQPKCVDVAPLALFNALRFNYSGMEECVLLVDIGAKSSQLVFVEPARLFIRGVPIAGNQITQALVTDLNVTPEEAETIKIERGFVGLGGAYEDPPDEVAARASKVIRQQMTRLHSEIARSIMSYRTQQNGNAPSLVLLSGGSSALPYSTLFFQDKLRMHVEHFNPFRNVAIGPTVDRDALVAHGHSLGEVVGLALRLIGPCPAEVDLVPVSAKAAVASRAKTQLAAAAAVATAALFGSLWFANFQQANLLAGQLDALESEHKALASVDERLDKAKGELSGNLARAEQAMTLAEQRDAWGDVLTELNKLVPEGIWITQLVPLFDGQPVPAVSSAPAAPPKPPPRPKKGEPPPAPEGPRITHISISGLYESYDADMLRNPSAAKDGSNEVKTFFDNLAKSPVFEMENQGTVALRTPGGNDPLAMPFSISVKLKEPIPLAP